MYQYGEGVSQAYDKAMEWYLKAVALGDENAKISLVGLVDDMKK